MEVCEQRLELGAEKFRIAMATHGMHERACRSWQFSLRGLMFVTTMVAIGAAIVSVSVGLSVLLVPLMAAGLFGTIRIAARQEAAGGAKTRLFATFSKSVVLIVATIAIGMATIAVAAMAGVLATLMVMIHVLRMARGIYRPIGRRLWQLLVEATKKGAMVVSRIEPVAILRGCKFRPWVERLH